MDLGDPRLLLIRVLVALGQAAVDDVGLERGIGLDERRIGAQRVPEREVAPDLLRPRLDMEVELERVIVDDDRADEHRPRRGPWVGARLRTEAQVGHLGDDAGDGLGRRGDGEVDHALAGQARHRRAADVLDDEVRTTVRDERRDLGRDLDDAWIPLGDGHGPARVGADRVTHGPSVDCGPCAS
jgi:hypothetical protein